MHHFPISGVDVYWWLPVVTAFCISSLTSTAGITGAFLILPFQVSILGFTGPAVSSTNLLYNCVAAPGGVYKYIRERRVVWLLTLFMIVGIMPGFIAGAVLRIIYMPNPGIFKLFVGCVLLYVALRLAQSTFSRRPKPVDNVNRGKSLRVTATQLDSGKIKYKIDNEEYSVKLVSVLIPSLIVGFISGIYGIGGGSFLAPILVGTLRQPVCAVSPATLISTYIVSVLGVGVYIVIGVVYAGTGVTAAPDWSLGLLFGFGGLLGIYTGAVLQKHIPVVAIKLILLASLLFIIVKYLSESLG